VFSKILERLVYDRLFSFLDSNNILTDKQYRFRERHFTYIALLNSIDRITEAIDYLKNTIVVKFEEINLKFEKVQDAHSVTTIIGRYSVTWA